MIPDYFTGYRRQLESYEAIVTGKLTALLDLTASVNADWQSVRKRRALMRLDQVESGIEDWLEKAENSGALSELIRLMPGDLPQLGDWIWRIVSPLTEDSFPRARTINEAKEQDVLKDPKVASILRGSISISISKVRDMIKMTPIPANMKATAYVEQKLAAEIRETLRNELFTADGAKVI